MKATAIVIKGVKVKLADDRARTAVAIGGVVRSPVLSGSVVVGHTTRGTAGLLDLVLFEIPNLADIRRVFMVSDAQLRLIWSTGEQWLMDRASYTRPPIIRDGELSISYSGRAWQPLQPLHLAA
jgi:hypothetical protein